jgi:hypothetical protein
MARAAANFKLKALANQTLMHYDCGNLKRHYPALAMIYQNNLLNQCFLCKLNLKLCHCHCQWKWQFQLMQVNHNIQATLWKQKIQWLPLNKSDQMVDPKRAHFQVMLKLLWITLKILRRLGWTWKRALHSLCHRARQGGKTSTMP